MAYYRYKRCLVCLIALVVSVSAWGRHVRDTLGAGTAVQFVENLGQWDSQVKFEAQLHGAALFLESDGITVALCEHLPHPAPHRDLPRMHAYKMHFVGAEPVLPTGTDRQSSYNNYFLGNDPSRWRSHVGLYLSAHYTGLYPGVDLEIYGGQAAMKYNFIVNPGADPSQIALRYEGADGISLNGAGDLIIKTSVRDIVEVKPYVFQRIGGKEREVKSRWRVKGNTVTIELGVYDPDEELVIDPVLIFSTYTGSTADNWGTTAAFDSGKNTYTAGLVFGIGYPVSLGAYQPAPDSSSSNFVDVGIFKFDTLGQNRLYATYLGGSSFDMPHSMFVNTFDELIIMGTTGSDNFPTTAGAYQTEHNGGAQLDYEGSSQMRYTHGSDIFVSRLSADGTQLQASTYIGGSGNDGLNYRSWYNEVRHVGSSYVYGFMAGNDSLYNNYGDGARGEIITDNLNNVYVGSTTLSTDFPTSPGCLQPIQGRILGVPGSHQDGVVFKLDHNLRTLLWSTYLGGSVDDAVYSIDVDSAYNLLVCGGTNSPNFPVTEGAWQTSYGGGNADGFVSKISYNGDRLMASSFVGNNLYDQLYFVRTGRHDEVFLFGQTKPADNSYFIHNAAYSVYNSGMLLMRMRPDLSDRVWSTLFGTPGRINLSPTAFAADICNRVYAVGWGRDFVGYDMGEGPVSWRTRGTTGMETTTNAWSDSTDGQDFYIISIDDAASHLEYATFFGELNDAANPSRNGADHVDGGTSRFDRLATLYQSVCGSCGGSNGFPTTAGAWSDSNRSSNCNNALFRFNVNDNFPVAEFIPPTAGCAPYTVGFRNTGRGASFHWDFGDGTTSTDREPTHTYTAGGLYTVTLIAYLPGGCAVADTQRHTLHVIGEGNHTFAPLISCAGARVQIGLRPQLGVTYQWLTPGVSDPTIANPWVNQAGQYLLRVSAPGCNEVDTFEVQTYTLVDHWETLPVSCHDWSDGSALLHLGPGIAPDSLTVTLSPSSTHVFDTARNIVFSGLAPGNYHVAVSGYGCLFEQDLTLGNPEPPRYEKTTSTPLCNDSCTGWINIHYNLSDMPEVPAADTLLSGLCEGTYIVALTSNGCPLTDTTVISRNHALDNFRAWADQTRFYLGETVQLHSTEVEGATYQWTPVTDLQTPTAPNTAATPADTLACYRVEVSVPDGCRASDSLCLKGTVITCGAPDYVIPNAFTPNGDGVNDYVDFGGTVLSELDVAVFNRWGECVYQSTDLANCRWDGTYKNQPCLPGVYTYTCRIRCHNGVETRLKGDITLIR